MSDGVLLAIVGIFSALIAIVGGGIIKVLSAQDAKNTRQQDLLEASHAEERRLAADRAALAAAEAAKREEKLMGIIETHNESLKQVAESNIKVAESQTAVGESMKSMAAAVEHKTDVLQQQVLITGALAEEIKKIDRIKEKE